MLPGKTEAEVAEAEDYFDRSKHLSAEEEVEAEEGGKPDQPPDPVEINSETKPPSPKR